MRLQRIYSSKIYLTSSRKDKIHAAINSDDIWNVELVQQLEDYLDDDAKLELKQAKQAISQKQPSSPSGESGDSDAPTDDTSAPPSRGGGGFTPSSFSGSPMDDFGEDELADIDIPDDLGGDIPTDDASAEEVVESVTQEGKPITANTIIWTTLDDVISDTDTIKGTLNAREDTKGVIRLHVTETELWIYYSDDINLNDKMIEVISVLNSTGYTYLKFNRLARSDNAIVFDISYSSTEQIKPTSEVEEKK